MEYLHWDQKTITDFAAEKIAEEYNRGFVFTRRGRGIMQQTRSVRINLAEMELSSENRRVLKKVADLTLIKSTLPFTEYNWPIGKLAKDFYEKKFGPGIMSAQKIKEILTNPSESNFNTLLQYSLLGQNIGYSICYFDEKIMHYSYPFYDMEKSPKDMGMGMMLLAIQYAKDSGCEYIYLGSLQRPGDTYKLQFKGLEWFDGNSWQTDTEPLRELLTEVTPR